MKRWILYAAVAGALILAPAEKTDVGELIPVEVVYVYTEKAAVCVETDTGDFGTGPDLKEALSNLKASAAGKIFLETADYLIITEEAWSLLPALAEILRPGAEVCLGINADAEAAEFLKAHKPAVTLRDVRRGMYALPVLTREEGRYQLESKGKA